MSIELQRAYVILANTYLALPEATRTCYAITAVNTLIFFAWKVPRLQGFMIRHFLHDPLSGRSYTLLTSMFRQVLAVGDLVSEPFLMLRLVR